MKLLIFLAALLTATADGACAQGIAADRPPMGWNSYNCYGSAVHEDEVKANADYMAAHLQVHGWEYIVVDFLWSYDNPPGSRIGNPFQARLPDGSYIPWLAMDAWGRLTPNTDKFPSASGGDGFRHLSEYIHSRNLRFGIHVMRGIPRQAVWAHCPVQGTNGITADQIADTSSTCPWMNHMYGLDMKRPGAQEYLNSLLALYASWGVDFIKVDDIARPYSRSEIEGYRKAIAACGRPIVLSISPGETPLKDSAHVRQYANMWRMADDFWDSWKELQKMFQYARNWEGIGGPGHWPDCDMIQIGRISKRGPVGPERYSRFTPEEAMTHMTFWCLYRSPLMLGGNLPENRDWEQRLFTNDEVLEVNQRGERPRQFYKDDSSMIWVSDAPADIELISDGRPVPDTAPHAKNGTSAGRGSTGAHRAIYVGLFNTGEQAHAVVLDLVKLGWRHPARVRDLWKKEDAGLYSKQYVRQLPPHGAALIKIMEK